jgi:asparagine synthase (glutamine-hydrolysing)
MCGIFGLYHRDRSRIPDRFILRRMSDALVHRGPDDEGLAIEGSAAIGMRRLSIMDVAHGQQPFYNECRTVAVVCNGEIYNYGELRALLLAKGHSIRTGSDVEVIPHLYEEFGLDFVKHLRGMFAVALLDREKNHLVLARDRAGEKPIYYTTQDGDLVFASEIGALLASGIQPSVDWPAIRSYLAYRFVPSPQTGFRDIRKLEAGHILVASEGRVAAERYWGIRESAPRPAVLSYDDAKAELRTRLERAVTSQLMSDVPLGAFLSGGVDSSIIVALMARASSRPIQTYSRRSSGMSVSRSPIPPASPPITWQR